MIIKFRIPFADLGGFSFPVDLYYSDDRLTRGEECEMSLERLRLEDPSMFVAKRREGDIAVLDVDEDKMLAVLDRLFPKKVAQ